MKLSQSIILLLAFLLLSFSAFAQSGAQSENPAKKVFDDWKRNADDSVKTSKRNFWAMAAIVEKTDGGAKVSFYITAANDTGKFGATEIIVQPVVSYYDKDGVPRTTDIGKAASVRIPAVIINKGQADERAAKPQITVAMPPTANAVKLIAKKILNKETVAEMVLSMNGDGYAGVLSTIY